MSKREPDANWPYSEEATPSGKAAQLENLALQDIALRFEKIATDYTELSVNPRSFRAQPGDPLNGGVLATLVDTAARQALNTTLKPDHEAEIIHLHTKYLQPVNDKPIFAEGSVVRKGRLLAHIDVSVMDEAGALVAQGWCIFKLTRRPAVAQTSCAWSPRPPVPAADCDGLQGGLGI